MWDFVARQLLKEVGRKIGGKSFNDEANAPEAYADRIKRDFHLRDYADAWALYDSDRAYWERWYGALPGGREGNDMLVRDSAAAAGIPGRNNVFEYGFPDAASGASTSETAPARSTATQFGPPDAAMGGLPSRSAGPAGIHPSNSGWPASSLRIGSSAESGNRPPSVFDAGVSPIPFPPPASQNVPGGLPGLMTEAGIIDPANPDRSPAGGLPGLIQQYLRSNVLRSN